MPEKEEEEEVIENKPFDNLDLRKITVFGGKKSTEKSWAQLAEQSKTLGWKNIDKASLEESLARAVDACYFRLVSFEAEDLDTDITWHASFLNSKGLWDLEISNSPKADIEPSQMADFFSSDPFKRIAKKAGWILEEAKHLLGDIVSKPLKEGQLLAVDEVKLAAITHWLSDKQLMENLRSGKFMEA